MQPVLRTGIRGSRFGSKLFHEATVRRRTPEARGSSGEISCQVIELSWALDSCSSSVSAARSLSAFPSMNSRIQPWTSRIDVVEATLIPGGPVLSFPSVASVAATKRSIEAHGGGVRARLPQFGALIVRGPPAEGVQSRPAGVRTACSRPFAPSDSPSRVPRRKRRSSKRSAVGYGSEWCVLPQWPCGVSVRSRPIVPRRASQAGPVYWCMHPELGH
jgi:hypothetical protein